MFENILLAADGSSHSIRAADKAIALTKKNAESYLTIVYAVDVSVAKEDVLLHWGGIGIDEQRKKKLQVIEEKAKAAGVNYDLKIIRGEPGAAIVNFAKQHKTDLVVIGSRGLNKLQEMVLGSVSQKVARRVQCPVLIVK
ncbi:universal stress protein [Desertibacillus haloalkaliphilus]|nr:universal stress protein [Desertibacillus haloalkaliphilus]